MKNRRVTYYLFGILFSYGLLFVPKYLEAQTNIVSQGTDSLIFNTNGNKSAVISPDGAIRVGGIKFLSSSSILELNSLSKGFLIPRVTSATSISDPKPGMIAYNTTTNRYIVYIAGNGWKVMLTSNSSYPIKIEDNDATTQITTDEGANDDSLRFYTNSARRMTIAPDGLVGLNVTPTSGSQFIVETEQTFAGHFRAIGSNTRNVGLYTEALNAGEINVGLYAYGESVGANDTAYAVIGESISNASGVAVGIAGLAEDVDASEGVGVQGMVSQSAGSASGTYYGGIFSAEGFGTGGLVQGLYATANGSGELFSGYFDHGKFFVGGDAGIGTTTPSAKFNVLDDVTTNDNTIQTVARFDRSFSGGIGVPGLGSRISLGGETTTEGSKRTIGSVAAEFIDPTDGMEEGALLFETVSSGVLSEKMRIDELGNVGIGTTTPSALLDVSGSIKITDGTEASGRVLTSDASGKANWQDPMSLPGSFTYPDGIDEIIPITVSGTNTTPYTVSSGKTLYITHARDAMYINGFQVKPLTIDPENKAPYFAGSGATVSLDNDGRALNGFEINSAINPITIAGLNTTSFSVPTGQKFYIFHVVMPNSTQALFIDGKKVIDRITSATLKYQSMAVPIVVDAGQVVSSSHDSMVINGYLR